jgi:hypothetical protein
MNVYAVVYEKHPGRVENFRLAANPKAARRAARKMMRAVEGNGPRKFTRFAAVPNTYSRPGENFYNEFVTVREMAVEGA